MPLALLAIGSALNPDKFEVIIVDGRLEADPWQALMPHLEHTICFGVTVITGAPIKDALAISKQVKDRYPKIPVVWGGWHPSLFPVQPLHDHTCIDITVQGQGEATFVELIACLDSNGDLSKVKGIAYRQNGHVTKNEKRHLTNVNDFAPVDYDLIDVEKYYQFKKRRQFDFISSIGCYYRCTFCADPEVYDRKFSAIDPDRMVDQMQVYYDAYQFEDVNFQDETFFTYPKRVEKFGRGIINRGLTFSWAATMRADQGTRLNDDQWQILKRSGLRRLLIGVESGSQEMMDWMKKDIKLTQVFHCANKCRELGIGVIFPFIVGFPNESAKSIRETIKVIKKLRKMSPIFDTPIFYFKPYPGSVITQQVVANGYTLPQTTKEWADFDYIGSSGPWVTKEKRKFFERFKFYLKIAYGKHHPILSPLRKIGQWRCDQENFSFPWEKYLAERIKPAPKLS